jgi:hypothetical protein
MAWPFERANDLGWGLYEILTSAQATLMDQNIAEGASGSIWTDAARGAPTPAGASIISPGSTSTSIAVPLAEGLNNLSTERAAWDGDQIYLFGGTPGSASQNRLRRSADSGATWASATNALAAGTQAVECLLWASGFSKFFLANGGLLESSATGASASWSSLGAMPNADVRTGFSYSPTLARILVMSESNARALRSDDGVTFTQETTAQIFQRIIWSPYYEAFFGFHSTGVYSSLTGLDGSWTLENALNFGTVRRAFVHGRILGAYCTPGIVVSVDGGENWTNIGPAPVGSSSNLVMTPTRLVFSLSGTHMLGFRFG